MPGEFPHEPGRSLNINVSGSQARSPWADFGVAAGASALSPLFGKLGNKIAGIPTPGDEQKQYLDTLFPQLSQWERAKIGGAAGTGAASELSARQAQRQASAQRSVEISNSVRQTEAQKDVARIQGRNAVVNTALASDSIDPADALAAVGLGSGSARQSAQGRIADATVMQSVIANKQLFVNAVDAANRLQGGPNSASKTLDDFMRIFGIGEPPKISSDKVHDILSDAARQGQGDWKKIWNFVAAGLAAAGAFTTVGLIRSGTAAVFKKAVPTPGRVQQFKMTMKMIADRMASLRKGGRSPGQSSIFTR